VTEPVERIPVAGEQLELELAAPPRANIERGTMIDMTNGDLVFDEFNDGAVFDYGSPTPEEFDKMLGCDGNARKLEQILTLPIRAATWSIEYEDGNEDVIAFVREALSRPMTEGGMRTPMNDVVGQMTSGFMNRRAYFEKVFKQAPNDFHWVYDKVAWRPPQTCVMLRDPMNGDMRGFKQEALLSKNRKYVRSDGYILIPPAYAMVYVHGVHRDPVRGISDMQVAYNCYETKQKVKFLWFTFLESQMLPRTILHGSGDTALKKAVAVVAGLKNAGVAGIPTSWVEKVTQLSVAGQGAAEFRNALNWLDSEASGSLLAGFSDLASKAVDGMGSYALSKDQSEMFLSLLTGYANEIGDCVTNYMIADLVWYNFGKSVPVPRFKVGPLNPDDVKMSLDLLKTLIPVPDANVPTAFVNELVMELGRILGMNLDKLRAAIDAREVELLKQAEEAHEAAAVQVETSKLQAQASVQAAAQVGTNMVQSAQNGGGTSANGHAKAPSGSSNN